MRHNKGATINVVKTHQLTFGRPVPGASRSKEGYRLEWSGTAVMGIMNMTPDSFSDGGEHLQLESALHAAKAMLAAGAFMLDIGGESTRPGATPVAAIEELERVLPVIKVLREHTDALISIDTRKPEVAFEAVAAGAHLVNDITGLQNKRMVNVCAELGVPAIIMHMQGEPQTMQENPSYDNVTAEVAQFLKQQAEVALAAGVPSVVLDPGFGFGKTLEHNLQLVRDLEVLTGLGQPVLLGGSRKGSLGKLAGVEEASDRDPASVALHLYGAAQGAALVRVHNVPMHTQALKVWAALDG